MSAKWGADWRKLYRHPSEEWLALPLSTRGLGDELIRVLDDDGRVFVGDDLLAGLMRVLRAHPSERRRVKADWAALAKDGFARVDGRYVVVRNFVDAQGAVSDAAIRMRRHRERAMERHCDEAGAELRDDRGEAGARLARGWREAGARLARGWREAGARLAHDVNTRDHSDGSVTVTQPIEEKRRDETRRDPERTRARDLVPRSEPPLTDANFVDPWAVATFLRDRSQGRISLTLLGTGERALLAALKQLAAQGWGWADLEVWADAAAVGADGWTGDYSLGQLLGAPEPDGGRACRGLAKCLETSRAWARTAAAAAAEKAREVAAYDARAARPWTPADIHPAVLKLIGDKL